MPPVASTSCAALLLNEEGAPPTHHSPPRASPVRVLAAPIINNHTSNNKFRFADPARRSVTPILPVAQPSPRPPPVPSPVPAPAAPKAVSPAKKVDLKGKGKATDEPTTSLLRRLAGPSDQKAGLQRDKEEVSYSAMLVALYHIGMCALLTPTTASCPRASFSTCSASHQLNR